MTLQTPTHVNIILDTGQYEKIPPTKESEAIKIRKFWEPAFYDQKVIMEQAFFSLLSQISRF